MADDHLLALPVGGRLVVFAGLRLGPTATEGSAEASHQLASLIDAWSGPGAVVIAGDLFDGQAGPALAPPALVRAALEAHPELTGALGEFSGGPGRSVVVLPGRRDAWLSQVPAARRHLGELTGAVVAPAVLAELATASGTRRARIEAGDRLGPVMAGTDAPAGPERQRLADVVPGLWRGSTSGWLSGLTDLDDPTAAARFVASRLVYRQFGRRAWLLGLPVLAALALRLPIALLHPARHVAGLLLASALAATLLELVVLVGLFLASLRQVWLAFSGQGGGPRDLNEAARAAARQINSAGLAGLVTAGTGRPELSPSTNGGFYANAGCCSQVVTECPPRLAALGLPSPFLAFRQVSWLELEAGNDLHARLLFAQALQPGATRAEKLLAPGQAVGPLLPAVVASHPHGPVWPPAGSRQVPALHRRARRAAASVVALAGFISVVSALSRPIAARLDAVRRFVPLVVPQAAGALAALAGVCLIMLARGIRRGQRRAYLVCEVTLVTVAALHLVRGGDIVSPAVALAVAVFLWARRGSFRASSDVPPLRRGLLRLAAVAGAAVGAATLTLEGTSWVRAHLDHHTRARVGWAQALLATVERMVAVRDVALPTGLDRFFTPAMFSVTVGLALYLAWLVFRPVVGHRQHRGTGALEQARAVVRDYGAGTLDYFALRSDKKFYFWGNTVVAYAVYSGTCLVSPDPIGPLLERERAWRAFREFADSNGWALAVMGAAEDWLPIYRASGMHDLYVGDEAVVRTGRFSLEGGKFKSLRQAVKRVGRYGYTISFHDPANVGPDLVAELEDVLTKSRRGGVERGFSMTLGRMFDPADEGLLLAVVHGPALPGAPGAPGPAVAFCQYVPAPAIRGFSLDLMRRDNAEHPNGLIDFAVVETVRYLAERGYQGLGLNFATMRAVLAGEAGDGLPQKVQAWLVRRMSGSMQIESLWRFNAKFDPDWQPRYAVYDSAEHALPAALAVARAESFWELPLIGRFLVPSAQRQSEAAGSAN
jgi:lysylphosphatidylglycerol synthetase-like protein (DUF2156 family)